MMIDYVIPLTTNDKGINICYEEEDGEESEAYVVPKTTALT